MKTSDLRDLEVELERRGLAPSVRASIRNAKIAVIDDRIDDLRGMLDGLRREGFTNLVEIPEVVSVSDLINASYDLIVLDLVGVASGISGSDGVGVLSAIKAASPSTPVIVVSGNSITPSLSTALVRADAIRNKPVMAVDLASDVESILRRTHDEYWAGLAVLKELHALDPTIREHLRWHQRLLLGWHINRLARELADRDTNVTRRLLKIASGLSQLGAMAARVTSIVRAVATGV